MKVIILGLDRAEAVALECIEAGASAYLLKEESLDNLVTTIHSVSLGETICSPRIAYRTFSRMAELTRIRREKQGLESENLTIREVEVLRFIVDGLSNKRIAERLNLSSHTVKNHVHNLLEKLRVSNRSEAAYYAMHKGLRRRT